MIRVTLVVALNCAVLLAISGCGGGGGGTPPPAPVPASPDFTVSVQPSSISIAQGASASFSVSISPANGFNSAVSFTLSGLPSGVTASPTTFNVGVGQKQAVTVQATTSAATGQLNLGITASSGSLTHSNPLPLSVTSLVITASAPLRTEYVRTDAQWELGYLNFAPQHWILYHSPTKRFFVSNTNSSRVEVFDAATESKIADIQVPNPWAGDETLITPPSIWPPRSGTSTRLIRSASVTRRFISSQIGPNGFNANVVRVLADGRLAILGTIFNVFPGGLPFIHGYQQLMLWDPITNSATLHGGAHVIALTADRTKILLISVGSVSSLTLFDPAANTDLIIQIGSGPDHVLVPPDGKEFLVPFGNFVSVYDSTTLALIDEFQITAQPEGFFGILSADRNTLFALERVQGIGVAMDSRTHVQKGWLANYTITDQIGYGARAHGGG